MNYKPSLKHDRFKRSRGGPSRWLSLGCAKCQNHILLYQKDGVGTLKRLYFDRIMEPKGIADKNRNLVCEKCQTVLGVPIIYAKEARLAYRLFIGTVEKKIYRS